MEHEAGNIDYISVARKILKNLGVSFPNGSYKEAIAALQSNSFLGWRICSKEEAQKYADVGVTSIGVVAEKLIIILPDLDTNDLLGTIIVNITNHPCIKHSSQFNTSKNPPTIFFAYSYGHIYW